MAGYELVPPDNRCRKEIPVPGTDPVPKTPLGPTLTVNGAPPDTGAQSAFGEVEFESRDNLKRLPKSPTHAPSYSIHNLTGIFFSAKNFFTSPTV